MNNFLSFLHFCTIDFFVFVFQFWPKDATTKTAMNYTGPFKVKYMMQQRMIRKQHGDDHYCAALKYTRAFAVEFKDYCTYICTDDKHKIAIGEPNMPLSALPRGKRVLVGRNETYQVSDPDFSNISLIPTVIPVTQLPDKVDNS